MLSILYMFHHKTLLKYLDFRFWKYHFDCLENAKGPSIILWSSFLHFVAMFLVLRVIIPIGYLLLIKKFEQILHIKNKQLSRLIVKETQKFPANVYLFKVNNGNIRKKCKKNIYLYIYIYLSICLCIYLFKVKNKNTRRR